MNALEVLKAARHLLSDPNRWTKRAYARAADGLDIDATSDMAVSFCAIGAMRHVTGSDSIVDNEEYGEAMVALNGAVVWPGKLCRTARFNDHPDTTHEDVLALYDRAIERLENA